ncbi:uncharacterized protein LOC132714694 [Ruditapes philippinarum]|uniref:uncharacterized protein LOC132714694 n=1 Tax=Ruditapes philippinarum TaxID=129788 RepID=UPI00295AEE28|nr:uncharacterized protein LOC132714694 [Ruditapes philippinarum]
MRNTASANVLSFFVLVTSVCLLYSSEFFVFRRNRVFDGYTCPEAKRVFSIDKVYSDIQCAFYCKGSSSCVDIFYQPQDRRCDGCRYSEDSELEIADGFLYYTIRRAPTLGKACSSNADCIETEGVCIGGMCFCHQLYAYNNTINDCTKVCQAMTGNYMKFENKFISGFNSDYAEYDSLEQCKIACDENPSCLSYEIYSASGKKVACNIGTVTYDMMNSADPTMIRDDSLLDLYSKTCS